MSVTEQPRLHPFKTLEQRLGDEDAATMMARLPPASSDGVATNEDVALLRSELGTLFELRLAESLNGVTNRFIGWMVATMAVQTALVGLLLSLTH